MGNAGGSESESASESLGESDAVETREEKAFGFRINDAFSAQMAHWSSGSDQYFPFSDLFPLIT